MESELGEELLQLAYQGKVVQLGAFTHKNKGKLDPDWRSENDDSSALIQCVQGSQNENNNKSDFLVCCKLLLEFGVSADLQDQLGRTALHWAVYHDKPAFVTELLHSEADPCLQDKEGFNPLHFATKLGYEDCVDIIARLGPKEILDIPSKAGCPPLIHAVQLGNIEVCHQLLEFGAEVNIQEKHKPQRTALHYALSSTRSDIFTLLLKYGARADIGDYRNKCVIHRAAVLADISYLEAIVEQHDVGMAGLDAQTDEGATALMLACQNQSMEHVRLLLDQKVLVKEVDNTGKTALHYCAENSDTACAKLLLSLDEGIINRQDLEGYTALLLAVIAGNQGMIKFLLAHGAKVNITDNEKHTAVHWATVCGHMEVIEILAINDADLATADMHDAYPLHYAAQMCGASVEEGGNPQLGLEMLRTLLSKQVAVDSRDQDERQPILWSASSGSGEACRVLVEAGADVNAPDKDGLTAMHCAASRGHLDCIDILSKSCSADVDCCDKNGCTPLFYAITLGHAKCAEFLLDMGSDPNHQDKKGRTPSHCAAAKGSKECAELLKKRKADMWIRNSRGEYPMHEAAQASQKGMVSFLVKEESEDPVNHTETEKDGGAIRNSPDGKEKAINVANNEGRTSLHVAAMTSDLAMCKLLLDCGANINPLMRNKDVYLTPFDAAVLRGNDECAKYLKHHGGTTGHKISNRAARVIQRRVRVKLLSADEPEEPTESVKEPEAAESKDEGSVEKEEKGNKDETCEKETDGVKNEEGDSEDLKKGVDPNLKSKDSESKSESQDPESSPVEAQATNSDKENEEKKECENERKEENKKKEKVNIEKSEDVQAGSDSKEDNENTKEENGTQKGNEKAIDTKKDNEKVQKDNSKTKNDNKKSKNGHEKTKDSNKTKKNTEEKTKEDTENVKNAKKKTKSKEQSKRKRSRSPRKRAPERDFRQASDDGGEEDEGEEKDNVPNERKQKSKQDEAEADSDSSKKGAKKEEVQRKSEESKESERSSEKEKEDDEGELEQNVDTPEPSQDGGTASKGSETSVTKGAPGGDDAHLESSAAEGTGASPASTATHPEKEPENNIDMEARNGGNIDGEAAGTMNAIIKVHGDKEKVGVETKDAAVQWSDEEMVSGNESDKDRKSENENHRKRTDAKHRSKGSKPTHRTKEKSPPPRRKARRYSEYSSDSTSTYTESESSEESSYTEEEDEEHKKNNERRKNSNRGSHKESSRKSKSKHTRRYSTSSYDDSRDEDEGSKSTVPIKDSERRRSRHYESPRRERRLRKKISSPEEDSFYTSSEQEYSEKESNKEDRENNDEKGVKWAVKSEKEPRRSKPQDKPKQNRGKSPIKSANPKGRSKNKGTEEISRPKTAPSRPRKPPQKEEDKPEGKRPKTSLKRPKTGKNQLKKGVQGSVKVYENQRRAMLELQRLKRMQMYATQLNEAQILKILTDEYKKKGIFGDNVPESLAGWEKYLYDQLRYAPLLSDKKNHSSPERKPRHQDDPGPQKTGGSSSRDEPTPREHERRREAERELTKDERQHQLRYAYRPVYPPELFDTPPGKGGGGQSGKGRNKATSPRQDKDELSSVSSSESVKLPRIEGGNQRLKTAGPRRRTSSQSGTRGDSPAYSSSNGSSGPQTFPRGKESSYKKHGTDENRAV